MQKNKIVLASLMGLFSLNATASAWMPSKDNALVYAAGGLAVVTGVLAYEVCQLTKRAAAADEADEKLSRAMKNKAEASDIPDVSAMAKQIAEVKSALDALTSQQTQTDVSGFVTKEDLKAHLTTAIENVRAADTACGKRFADHEKTINQRTDATIEIQQQTIAQYQKLTAAALEAHKKAFTEALKKLNDELINTLTTNDAARQNGIIEIQKKLETFVLLERLDQALKPIKDATDKAKQEATLAKSEAEKATRASQRTQDEVRALGERVTDLAKNITTNAAAKANAETNTDAPAAAAATPAAAPANA